MSADHEPAERYACNCHSVWCRLDVLFRCRVRWICDRHDAVICQ